MRDERRWCANAVECEELILVGYVIFEQVGSLFLLLLTLQVQYCIWYCILDRGEMMELTDDDEQKLFVVQISLGGLAGSHGCRFARENIRG